MISFPAMESFTLQSTYKIHSGYEIPIMGLGVFQTPPDVTEKVVLKALDIGYRHVDCAKVYQNEGPCGEAMRRCSLDRSKIFFTTKIPRTEMGYENAKNAISSSLLETKLDYIDLVLIHAPFGGKEAREGTWRALVEAQREGKVRSIGVSNFGVHHLDELEAYINTGVGGHIDIGQYEIHPWCPRDDIVGWLQKRGVVIEAYSPLVRAKRMNEPVLDSLAKKYNKTPAQILVRWSLQKGYVPLPKSVSDDRILENIQVFDFELEKEDMNALITTEYSPVCWDPTIVKD